MASTSRSGARTASATLHWISPEDRIPAGTAIEIQVPSHDYSRTLVRRETGPKTIILMNPPEREGNASAAEPRVRIDVPYLNVINIPLHRDGNGIWWGDPLWVKDLLLHLDGISDFRLLCPIALSLEPGWIPFDTSGIKIITVKPAGKSWMLHLPSLYARIDRAIKAAQIVHTGVGGWPFPLGWLATLANVRHRRFLVIVIESSFWRIPAGARPSIGRQLTSRIFELLAGICAKRADLLVGTQPKYLELAGPGSRRTFLNPASWIDDVSVLSPVEAERIWKGKEPRLVYAGRLTRDKGIPLLLEALRQLGDEAPALDIIGEGELLQDCLRHAESTESRVRVLKPVSYGPDFFRVLDGYMAVVVPTISDEQPRIIFDAYARAIPILGSSSPGVASCVTHDQTGWLFENHDTGQLIELLRRAGTERQSLVRMGQNGLAVARNSTHQRMHRTRLARMQSDLAARAACNAHTNSL